MLSVGGIAGERDVPIVQLSEEEIARLIQAVGKLMMAHEDNQEERAKDQKLMEKLFKIRAAD